MVFILLGKHKSMRFGLIIDYKFHRENKWVSALTPHLVNTFIDIFDPVIITSQREYNKNKSQLKAILMMEPGWAAPFIKFDSTQGHIIAMTLSDPHSKKSWFEDYFFKNNLNYVLSYYKSPFFFHFPDFPVYKFVHFPWAIPDQFISKSIIKSRNNEVAIFGGKNNEAYDMRNWCREQDGIKNYLNSGTENKVMDDTGYFKWLSMSDAIVAAGSSNPIYDLVTPKYFEIASSGALLIGQYCHDLRDLGFNNQNMVIFKKNNFNEIISKYKKSPKQYLKIRKQGLKLIFDKHTITSRIQLLKKVLGDP